MNYKNFRLLKFYFLYIELFTAIIKISYQDYDSKISYKSLGLEKIIIHENDKIDSKTNDKCLTSSQLSIA